MEFKRAIVDELGTVMHWCCDLSPDEVEELLDIHPEWIVRCVEETE